MILRGDYSVPLRASTNGVNNPIFDFGLKDESQLRDKAGNKAKDYTDTYQPGNRLFSKPPFGPSTHRMVSPILNDRRRDDAVARDHGGQHIDNDRHECVVEMEGRDQSAGGNDGHGLSDQVIIYR